MLLSLPFFGAAIAACPAKFVQKQKRRSANNTGIEQKWLFILPACTADEEEAE
jgi:hypothetical protein